MNNAVKILQVVDDFPPSIAGDGIHVHHISKELARRGHKVTVLTADLHEMNTTNVQAPRIRAVQVLDVKTMLSEKHGVTDGITVKRFRPLFRAFYSSFPPALFSALMKEDFDVIHIHRYFTLLSYPAMLTTKLKGKPWVFTPHSATIREKKGLLQTAVKKMFDCSCGRSLIRSPNILVALTQDNMKDYIELGAEASKIRVIPNGVSLEEFKNLPDPTHFKEKYRIAGQVVLSVGRLVKYKGIQYLLRIAPRILEEAPQTKFVIVGPDFGYKNQLVDLVNALGLQKSVVFTGVISDYELLEAYSAADVFAFPSIHEGFGLVLLDAMACRKPIVTWKTSAMQYVVTDQAGFLIQPWNLEDFAQSIITLLSNKELAADMGAVGRKIVEERFNWKVVIDALESVYEELMGN